MTENDCRTDRAGRGELRYQPGLESGSSSEGTSTEPSGLRPSWINDELIPIAGTDSDTGGDAGSTGPVVAGLGTIVGASGFDGLAGVELGAGGAAELEAAADVVGAPTTPRTVAPRRILAPQQVKWRSGRRCRRPTGRRVRRRRLRRETGKRGIVSVPCVGRWTRARSTELLSRRILGRPCDRPMRGHADGHRRNPFRTRRWPRLLSPAAGRRRRCAMPAAPPMASRAAAPTAISVV